jgi:hypothetical protein
MIGELVLKTDKTRFRFLMQQRKSVVLFPWASPESPEYLLCHDPVLEKAFVIERSTGVLLTGEKRPIVIMGYKTPLTFVVDSLRVIDVRYLSLQGMLDAGYSSREEFMLLWTKLMDPDSFHHIMSGGYFWGHWKDFRPRERYLAISMVVRRVGHIRLSRLFPYEKGMVPR